MANSSDIKTEPGDGQWHDVYMDRRVSRTEGGHRYTCHSCEEGPGTTCLRQPYMTDDEQWEKMLQEWSEQHPFKKAKRYRGE